MNFQILSNPSPFLLKLHPFPFDSISPSRVYNSLYNSGNQRLFYYGKLSSSSRFSSWFCNSVKRVSRARIDFRNGGDLVKVRCGGVETEEEEADDRFYMRRCVEIARKGVGYTSPNPMVGCVIVKDGQIVGEGFHPKAGQPHAEVFALRDAGERAENATAYVSLEPCNHYGRTPPCTEALIKAKVKKVVVGMVDRNPIVASRGLDRLRNAGIEVIVGVEEDLCQKLIEAFTHKMLTGKPFVTLRYSISINGVLIDQLGPGARECGGYYSKLLQEYDAVIHSPTTPTNDFGLPASSEPNANQPLHILLAKNPDFSFHFPNFPLEESNRTIMFTNEVKVEPESTQNGIETVTMDQISLDAILDYCSTEGFLSVLIDLRRDFDCLEDVLNEGFEKNLLQRVVVEVLPFWAGCEDDIRLPLTGLTRSRGLKNLSSRVSGQSVLLEGYF